MLTHHSLQFLLEQNILCSSALVILAAGFVVYTAGGRRHEFFGVSMLLPFLYGVRPGPAWKRILSSHTRISSTQTDWAVIRISHQSSHQGELRRPSSRNPEPFFSLVKRYVE